MFFNKIIEHPVRSGWKASTLRLRLPLHPSALPQVCLVPFLYLAHEFLWSLRR